MKLKSLITFFLLSLCSLAHTQEESVFGDSATVPGSLVYRARGHFAGKERLFSGDVLNGMYGRGWDGTAFSLTDRVSIQFQASETWTPTANGTKILFRVTPPGTTTPVTAMTIDGGTVTFSGGFSLSSMSVVDAYSDSFGAVNAGSTSTITWTEVTDRLGEFVTSSFTATSGGYYEVISHAGVSQTAGSACLILKVNATSPAGGSSCNQGVTALASILDISITRILNLNAGDIVRLDASATTANATFQKLSLTVKELP